MNTTVWLITFICSDGKPAQVVHAHNCIADYRQLDPNATAKAIDCAAVAELIDAATITAELLDDETAYRLRVALANVGERS